MGGTGGLQWCDVECVNRSTGCGKVREKPCGRRGSATGSQGQDQAQDRHPPGRQYRAARREASDGLSQNLTFANMSEE